MKNLSIKTRVSTNEPKYKENLDVVTTFLRHSEDKITVISGETVNIEIYSNGGLLFSGDKTELFEILQKNK